MKTLIFLLLLAGTATAQQTGYLISIQNEKTMKIHMVTTTAAADSLTGLNASSLLIDSDYFEVITDDKRIYCEKKELIKTRTGKIKFGKLKN